MSNTLRQNLTKPDVALRYKFLYNSIDYTDLILDRGLNITRNVNLSAGLMPILLNNAGGWWNFLFETNTALGGVAEIQIYVDGDVSNTLTIFKGFVKDPRFEGATVRLMIKDHASAWLERKVGSNLTPATWFSGTLFPSAADRVWRLLTYVDYGNLDDTDNPLNLDIDYVSFASWRDNHVTPNSYELRGRPTGQTVGELLMMICQLTHSYIWVNNDGKVAFAPPYGPGYSYDEGNTGGKSKPGGGRDLNIETRDILNDVTARYGYHVDSGTWNGNVSDTDATSIAQFDTFPKVIEGRVMFHRNEPSATSDRDATLVDYAYPIRFLNLIAGVPALMEDLCNQVIVSDTLKEITNATAIIEEIAYNLDTFEIRMKARYPW